MKNSIALAALGFIGLFGATAHADTQLIERHDNVYDFNGTVYHFDAQKGTAWIDVLLSEQEHFPIDNPPYHAGPIFRGFVHEALVPGLSYDAAAAQIIYTMTTTTEAGSVTTGVSTKIVCATVTEKHGTFGNKWLIHLTDSCRTYSRFENHGVNVYFEAK